MQFLFVLVTPVAGLSPATGARLVACFRQTRSRAALAVRGTGLLTGGVFLYGTTEYRHYFAPWATIGFAVAFFLAVLAGLVPVRPHANPNGPAPPSPWAMWTHAFLPCVVLGNCGLLVVAKL
ncbi:hypothetical protein [Pseudofrankia sp. DC12]|uniref:hypothetical protein n=1 Tax=Pseudofrankia sp. DC12 TaxID=683315 RepID=UPI000695B127|nr:hypothetical protein [Pseudofrankia sp. DC12]